MRGSHVLLKFCFKFTVVEFFFGKRQLSLNPPPPSIVRRLRQKRRFSVAREINERDLLEWSRDVIRVFSPLPSAAFREVYSRYF